MWRAEDAKDVVLDAFGLLFLFSLSEYAGGLDFGVDDPIFTEDVDERTKLEHDRTHDEGVQESISDREALARSFWNGNFIVVLARCGNMVCACFAVPAFAYLQW